jgi:hypothetical protein
VQRTASGVNISTVYRNLELLEELGLLQHTHLGHGAPTYSLASDHEHVHLVCRDCGGIDEAPPEVAAPDRGGARRHPWLPGRRRPPGGVRPVRGLRRGLRLSAGIGSGPRGFLRR